MLRGTASTPNFLQSRYINTSNSTHRCFLSSPAVWGLVRVLSFSCCWSALVGRLSVLECAFWGFLLLFALLHLFPLLRLFATPYTSNIHLHISLYPKLQLHAYLRLWLPTVPCNT